MEDEKLLQSFEDCTLPGSEFTHPNHVRVAWMYLRRHRFPDALARFTESLKRFASAAGAPEKYHATITVAYMLIIAERLDETPAAAWSEFASAHADLLARQPSVLERYYSAEALNSERAKREFVMPDRAHLTSRL
jgi:hypothetical protein